MHSVIERAAKNIQVNTPSGWQLIDGQLSRKITKPYNVVPMTHDSFINWTSLAEGNKSKPRYETVDGKLVEWRQIKWFMYQTDHPDSIFFKYRYDDKSFKEMKLNKRVGRPLENPKDLPKAY